MDNKLISIMTERIVRDFDPLQITLFGSQARGDVDRDSDIEALKAVLIFFQIDFRRTYDLNVPSDLLPNS